MVKVTRAKAIPVPRPDIVITLDEDAAKEILKFLGNADTPRGGPFELWDTLDDVVHLGKSEAVRA